MAFEDDLLALEQRIVKAAAGDWLGRIDDLRRLLAMESPMLRAAVLELVAPHMEVTALAGLIEAAQLGAEDAAAIARRADLSAEAAAQLEAALPKVPTVQNVDGGRITRAEAAERMFGTGSREHKRALALDANAAGVSKTSRDALNGLDRSAESALAKARRLIEAGAAIEAALAPLFESSTHVRATLESTINATANEAVIDVADATELPLVWVAERNACVECLAYAGQVARDQRPFPGGLTFGRKSYNPDSVKGPPRHPHCRCHLEPLVAEEYAEGLRREAVRSVLRGYSLENESMGVRVDAAQRLVARVQDPNDPLTAPKTVVGYAARAIKAGEFPSRVVPTGRAAA